MCSECGERLPKTYNDPHIHDRVVWLTQVQHESLPSTTFVGSSTKIYSGASSTHKVSHTRHQFDSSSVDDTLFGHRQEQIGQKIFCHELDQLESTDGTYTATRQECENTVTPPQLRIGVRGSLPFGFHFFHLFLFFFFFFSIFSLTPSPGPLAPLP